MRMFKNLIFVVLLCVFGVISGCDEDDDYDAVFVEMKSDLSTDSLSPYKVLYGGFAYRFTLKAHEYKGKNLSRLTINTFDRERGDIQVLDTALSGKDASFEWIYIAPSILATDTLELTFTVAAYNTTGESCKLSYKNYAIVQKDMRLTAIQGITMYAIEGESKPNGYSFSRQLPIRTSLSEEKDIDIYCDVSEEEPEILTHRWRTKNDIYFIKNNSFDYAGATRRSVMAAFNSSVSYHIVDNISDEDVIIVGNSANAIGVIKIRSVYDEDGSLMDRYYFDFKPV